MASLPKSPYSFGRLAAYGSLAVPLQALLNPMLIFLPPFYAAEMGLNLAAVGLVFFLARTWDAVTDPIIGGLSDRTRSKYGRRRPWIVAATPFVLISSFFVLVPQGPQTVTSLGLSIFVFYVFWTMVYIPYQSWGAEISDDYIERTRIAGYREAGTVLGVLVGIGIPLLLIDPIADPIRRVIWPDGLGLDTSLGSILEIIFVTVLVLLPITVVAACSFMPETVEKSPAPISWRQTASVIVRNKPFQRLFTGYFVAQLGFLIFLSSVTLLITRGLEIEAFLFLVFVQHLVAILAVPFWLKVADRFGKHRAYCASLAVIIIGFLSLNAVEPGDLWMATLVFLFNGLGSSGKLILPAALAADTVDYDTLRTGSREAGTHVALLNLANKATFALSVGISFPLLALAGFDPSAAQNTQGAINALMAIGTLLPSILLAVGIAIMWSFPLNKKRYEIVQKSLQARQRRAET